MPGVMNTAQAERSTSAVCQTPGGLMAYSGLQRSLLVKRARMQGFLVFDYQHRYEEAIARLAGWLRAGKLRYREDVLEGIEHAPGAIEVYRGENLGKRLIRPQHD